MFWVVSMYHLKCSKIKFSVRLDTKEAMSHFMTCTLGNITKTYQLVN